MASNVWQSSFKVSLPWALIDFVQMFLKIVTIDNANGYWNFCLKLHFFSQEYCKKQTSIPYNYYGYYIYQQLLWLIYISTITMVNICINNYYGYYIYQQLLWLIYISTITMVNIYINSCYG